MYVVVSGSKSNMPSSTLKMGLIGAGRIGRVHGANLALRIPAADLRVVADLNAAAAVDFATQHGIPRSVGDYRAVLEDPELEAVVTLWADAALRLSETDLKLMRRLTGAQTRLHDRMRD